MLKLATKADAKRFGVPAYDIADNGTVTFVPVAFDAAKLNLSELPVTTGYSFIVPPLCPAVIVSDVSDESDAVTTTNNDRAIARALAAKAIAAYYGGKSLPFKAASELRYKAEINFALQRNPTARSAALIATILTYCDIEPGFLRFVRGSGRVPGKLLGYTGNEAERIHACGAESGGLSNMLGQQAEYVSGPLAGPGCENAIFRLNYTAALANLRAFNQKQSDGEHLFSAAIVLLEMLATPTVA